MKNQLSIALLAISLLVGSLSFASEYSCNPNVPATSPVSLSPAESRLKIREIIAGASSPENHTGGVGKWGYEASRYSSNILKGHASLVTEFRSNGQWLYQIEKFDCEWQHLDGGECQFSCQVQNADYFD